jgi:hypothetical protein
LHRRHYTFSANYNLAYINTDKENSKTNQILAYVTGTFNSNTGGIQKTGPSSGFIAGTARSDNDGFITSTGLTVTVFGGVNGDSVFQLSGKATLAPAF